MKNILTAVTAIVILSGSVFWMIESSAQSERNSQIQTVKTAQKIMNKYEKKCGTRKATVLQILRMECEND